MNFEFATSYLALWAVVLFQGLIILALMRQLEELRKSAKHGGLTLEHLPTDSRAPEFAGVDFRSGRRVASRDLEGRGGVILFLSACPVCVRLVSDLNQVTTIDMPPMVAVCQGGDRACAGIAKGLPREFHLILEHSEEIAARYLVDSSPTAVFVDETLRIRGYGHPENVGDLKLLIEQMGVAARDPGRQQEVRSVVLNSGATQ
ncbi:MAG: hypothetical protein L0387_40030 [Acidobacteria bacterium]|nr:hypothetical protein [Acidobacteriota bacterium]